MTAMTDLTDLLSASADIQWKYAACRGDAHPDRWFPDPSESLDYAARTCAHCLIKDACAEYASATGQSGVWGGVEYRRGRVVRLTSGAPS
ncbi:WhiB family transcriptional regulator [Rhodococcus sp. WMMA185]|uniref:WhiB family transcriptional regulator n=1 Tax=Rhodococcus sp. WMMA185 TaxID=679318 RepID=UPI0009FCC61D|nr:WhiB family transcriptional regulator [Rhodococcus sp. WMMA185]